MDTFDIIVIGMGPGGEHVAGTLAERGLRVLGIDHGLVGGECPYWGCIPSKMMVRAGDVLAETGRVAGRMKLDVRAETAPGQAGIVLRQSPKPGVAVAPGLGVKLVVGDGSRT